MIVAALGNNVYGIIKTTETTRGSYDFLTTGYTTIAVICIIRSDSKKKIQPCAAIAQDAFFAEPFVMHTTILL